MKKIFLILLVIHCSLIVLMAQLQWIKYTPDNSGILSWNIFDITFDSLNVKWIATWDKGIIKFDGVTWVTFDTINSPLPSNSVKTLKFDNKNILWIGTNKGLVRYDGVNWTIWDSIIYKYVYEIAVDNNNIKWMATLNSGLLKYNDTTMFFYRTDNSGIQTNGLTGIVLDHNIKWMGTGYNGAIKFNDSTFVNYTYLNSGIGSNYIRCISIDNNGDKWFGKQADYAVKYDSRNNIWTAYNDIWPGLTGGTALYVYNDSRNLKWFGTNNGLFNYNDTTLTYYNLSGTGGAYYYFREDKFNNIWFCTNNGLHVHNPNGIVSVKKEQNLMTDKFYVHRIYPNPFNSQSKIKYDIPMNGNIAISLYDIIGKKIKTLINEYKQSGSYEYNFNSGNLSSGIYFLKFDFENTSITKRIILLK